MSQPTSHHPSASSSSPDASAVSHTPANESVAATAPLVCQDDAPSSLWQECHPAGGVPSLRLWPSHTSETCQATDTLSLPLARSPSAATAQAKTQAPVPAQGPAEESTCGTSRRPSTSSFRRRLQKPAPSSPTSSSNDNNNVTVNRSNSSRMQQRPLERPNPEASLHGPALECGGGGPSGPGGAASSPLTRVLGGAAAASPPPATSAPIDSPVGSTAPGAGCQSQTSCIPDPGDSKWRQYLDQAGLTSRRHHKPHPHPLPLRQGSSASTSSHRSSPQSKTPAVAAAASGETIPPTPTSAVNTTSSKYSTTASGRRSRSGSWPQPPSPHSPPSGTTTANMDNTKPIISPPPKPHQNKLRKTLSKRGFLSPSSFKIGQLDGSAPRRREIRVVKRRASIELIAEQYQAILESRDFRDEAAEAAPVNESEHERPSTPDWWQHQSHHNHSPRHSPPRQGSPQNHSPRHHSPPRQASPRYDGRSSQEDTLERLSPTRFDPSAADRSREVVLDMPARPPGPPNLSPASDGTLVAFEEDAIYFKPISFSSPEPSPTPDRQSFEDKPLPMTPPQQRRQQHRQPQQQPRSQSQHKTRSRATSQSDQPGNALQTCIAMLVRELTTSMPAQQKQVSAQQLQVETMIEAYERLRDQAVMGVGAGDAEQQRAVRSMFDCWLAALHTMHRGFARRGSDQEIMAEDVD